MELLIFAVAVLVSMVDPLLAIAYVGAGFAARDWRIAALYGPLAGAALLVCLALMRGGGWQPKAFNVAAQLVACLIGAIVVRLVIDLVRPRHAGATGK